MKKYLLFLLLTFLVQFTNSQIVIPNGSFESWSSVSCKNPQSYPFTSNVQNYYRTQLPFNVSQSMDAYSGTYAVSLSTVANVTDTAFAYFINGNPDGDPTKWHGGMPYNEMPTGIQGYYKYNVASADSATLFVIFSKEGVNIGSYFLPIGGVKTDYTLFDLALSPPLAVQPDSVMFGALSCKFNPMVGEPHGPAGSTLLLDNVSFVGVATQPALMDGDFEQWVSKEFNSVDGWYTQTEDGNGFSKSMSAIDGTYALELNTYLGSDNGLPVARQGYMSNGYYPDNCGGNCPQIGGIPFDNQIDTLAFSYKYSPAPNDVASVYLKFTKNGANVMGNGNYFELVAKGSYYYQEMPFMLMQEPDTVIIEILSSKWDHNATSYVGSVLTIDNLHFKNKGILTQLETATEETKVTVVPNPSEGKFQISGLSAKTEFLEIINISGEVIYLKSNLNGQTDVSIDLSSKSKGIYFIRLDGSRVLKTQKVVIK